MSDRKKITVLASLCAVLTLTLILGTVFSGNRRSARVLNEPLLSSFSAQKVNRIELFTEEKSTVLTETDNVWSVDYDGTAAPADAAEVKSFLKTVAELPRGKKITANEEKYAQFGVASYAAASFIKMTADNGSEILLLFGNAVADRPGFRYVRAEGDKQVYETADPGLTVYGRRSNWVSLNLFADASKSAEVQSVSVKGTSPLEEGGTFDYTLIRTVGGENDKELVWKAEGSEKEVDGAKIDSLVRQITELKGADLVVPSTGITPENAAVTLVLGFRDGTKQTVCVSAETAGEERFAVTVAGSGKEYAVSRYALGNILKPLADFEK